MSRAYAPLASLAGLCLAVSGCGGSARRAEAPGSGTFTMAIDSDLGAFDPYRSRIFSYYKLAYDSLVNLKPDGTFASGLAQKWSADATSASFTLRPNITCSDGTPLTAKQVAADLTYLSNPKKQSPLYGLTIPKEPFTATADDAARTVSITMKKPFGFLLNTIGVTPIMCARGLKDPTPLKSGSDGTGPFVLTDTVAGQSYTFTVRKGYTWGPGGASTSAPGTPGKVVVKVVTNETTAANLLLSGALNLAMIKGPDSRRLTARGLGAFSIKGSGDWLWFNQLGGRPTADKRVRQALVSALDLGQLIKVSTGGRGSASTGLVAVEPKPCSGNTIAGRLPRHDVAAAGALLDSAGWTKGPDGTRAKNGKPLAINVYYVPPFAATEKPTAELLAQQWKDVGVRVKLTPGTLTGLTKVLFETSDYDVQLGPTDINLPSQMVNFLTGQAPPNGQNFAGVHNEEYAALVAKAASFTAPAACTYWNQAERALWRDVDLAPISNQSSLVFLQKAQAQTNGWDLAIPTSIRLVR